MKKITLYIFAIGLLTITGCTSPQKATELPEHPDLSWEVFQKVKGCKSTKTHEELVNEYFDTWRGSVEEEKAFMDLGIELN